MTFLKLLFISSRPRSSSGLFPVSLSDNSAPLSQLVSLRPLRLRCTASGIMLALAAPLLAAASAFADPVQQPSRQKTVSHPVAASLDPDAEASTLALSSASASATLGKSAGRGAPADAHAPLPLTILTENAPTEVAKLATRTATMSSQVRFDFGSVSSLSPGQHVQTYLLRNDNKVPVTVSQLQSSSGCLQAAFASSEVQLVSSAASPTSGPAKRTVLHQLLPPGQQVPLHITLNSTAMAPGAVDQSLWVFVEGQAMPAATLKVTGTLQPLLQFSPKVLDFGTTSAADKSSPGKNSLALTVTLDPQLAAGGLQPQVVCSNPNIKVNLVSTTASDAPISGNAIASAGVNRPVPGNHPALISRPVVQTYSVRLSPNAALGTLKSRLIFSFVLPARSQPVLARLQATVSQPALPKETLQDAVLVIIPVAGSVTK